MYPTAGSGGWTYIGNTGGATEIDTPTSMPAWETAGSMGSVASANAGTRLFSQRLCIRFPFSSTYSELLLNTADCGVLA
jgi:hypothetical protein